MTDDHRGASARKDHPRGYVCPRTKVTPRLTGKLDDDVWGHAPWSEEFVDIEGEQMPRPYNATRMKMLWDDECLYIGAWMDEPHVWATLTEHDCIIYQDNDFEVFLDPNEDCHHYVELELNALNTTWDLMLTRPYRAGGKALTAWEFKDLRTAVHIEGTLNDASDADRGWSTEIAIPWASLTEVTNRPLPPQDGDQWRIDFSRVEWDHEIVDGAYRKVPNRPEYNWVWAPTGIIDMHRPERWGVLQFAAATDALPSLRPLPEWEARVTLVDLWEAQKSWSDAHGRFAHSLQELGFDASGLAMQATDTQFSATLGSFRIDHDWKLTRTR